MKASDWIINLFETYDIEYVFGYQGGMITHLIDSISKSKKIKFIQCYHEQSAAIAAEGYAIKSRKFGVAISTSGPGATNMLTGIADAYFGSIAVIYITGQVNSYEYKYDKPIRQLGFQETDIVSMVKPITKYAVMIDKIENLQNEFLKAIQIATTGRKGPVLIDLPMNIQRENIEYKRFFLENRYNNLICDFSQGIKELKLAQRPLVICGNGIIQSGCENEVQRFLNITGIPYAVSMLGKSAADECSNNFVGMIGSYGNRCANIIFANADVVLVLGSRLDSRQSGNIKSNSLKNIKFIHIDIDKNELDFNNIKNKINLYGNIQDFLYTINPQEISINKNWKNYCNFIKEKYSQRAEINRFVKAKEPYIAIENIRNSINKPTIFITDIGQNQIWAAQYLSLKKDDEFITSGGLAPMGFAIPCAIGVAFANKNKKIVCIVGDGGFHISTQSLMLISQYKLNISIFVLNNESLGMITQFQNLYFDSNKIGASKDGGYLVPNIEHIAKAYNIKYYCINDINDINKYYVDTISICEIKLPYNTIASPKLEFNRELYDMTPSLNNDECINYTSQTNI